MSRKVCLEEKVVNASNRQSLNKTGTISFLYPAKLLQKSEMRKDIVIELSYKGFG